MKQSFRLVLRMRRQWRSAALAVGPIIRTLRGCRLTSVSHVDEYTVRADFEFELPRGVDALVSRSSSSDMGLDAYAAVALEPIRDEVELVHAIVTSTVSNYVDQVFAKRAFAR